MTFIFINSQKWFGAKHCDEVVDSSDSILG